MDNFKIKYILVTIWLIGLMFCLIITLLAYQDIPELFGKVLTQTIDTFAPQLATMLAFVFSDQLTHRTEQNVNKPVAILAIVISSAYVSFFCAIMLAFQLEKYRADQVIELFDNIRPKTSFLVTAMIAYYFASRKAQPETS